MNPNQILSHLHTQPFKPLRLFLSDGSHFDVEHPELALVTRTEVAIAIGDASLPDHMVYCDPIHITLIEPLNGKRKKTASKKRKKA